MSGFVNINCTTNVAKIEENRPKLKIKQSGSTRFVNIVYIMQIKMHEAINGCNIPVFLFKNRPDTDFTEIIEIGKKLCYC